MKLALMLFLAAVIPTELFAGSLVVKTPPNATGTITLHRWDASDAAIPLARLQVPSRVEVPDGTYGLSIGDYPFRHGPIKVAGDVTIELAAFAVNVPKDSRTPTVALFDRSSGQLVSTFQPPGHTVLPPGRFVVRRDGSNATSPLELAPNVGHVENWGALHLIGPSTTPVLVIRTPGQKEPELRAGIAGGSSTSALRVERRIDGVARPFSLPPGSYHLVSAENTRPYPVEITSEKTVDLRTMRLTLVDMSKEAQSHPLRIVDAKSGVSIAWWDKTMPATLPLIGDHERIAIERKGVTLGAFTTGANREATVWILPSGSLAIEGDAGAIPVAFANQEPIIPGKLIRVAYVLPSSTNATFRLVSEAAGESVPLGDARVHGGRNETELAVPEDIEQGKYRIVVTATLPTGERLAGRTDSRVIHRRITSAPGALHVTRATPTSLSLAWVGLDSASGAAGYNLYRGPATRPVNGRTPIAALEYEDIGLGAGRDFTYRVCPVDALGLEGPCSSESTGSTARP